MIHCKSILFFKLCLSLFKLPHLNDSYFQILKTLLFLANRDEILRFIKQCQHKSGGISASIGHDPHLLYTLSAIQILVILDALDDNVVDLNKVVEFIQSLQQEDGSFFGDKWGEVDVRFSFCAIASLKILKREQKIDLEKAICFVMKCHNFIDGGFGSKPGEFIFKCPMIKM